MTRILIDIDLDLGQLVSEYDDPSIEYPQAREMLVTDIEALINNSELPVITTCERMDITDIGNAQVGIRGVPAGMDVYLVQVSGWKTDGGWASAITVPTMYTVGGCASDAIENAIRVMDIRPGSTRNGDTVQGFTITAMNSDPDNSGDTATRHYGTNDK